MAKVAKAPVAKKKKMKKILVKRWPIKLHLPKIRYIRKENRRHRRDAVNRIERDLANNGRDIPEMVAE